MLLYFIKVSVSSPVLAAYNIVVLSALFGVLFKAAASGVMKICQNLCLTFLSINIFLARIMEQNLRKYPDGHGKFKPTHLRNLAPDIFLFHLTIVTTIS